MACSKRTCNIKADNICNGITPSPHLSHSFKQQLNLNNMIVIENKQVFSDEGKLIHRIGTETYVKRSMVLPTDIVEMFEEVDELPAYTKQQYDEKVAELVRERYSESEEFAIQRKYLNTIKGTKNPEVISEYEAYNDFVEECKIRAKNPDLYTNPTA